MDPKHQHDASDQATAWVADLLRCEPAPSMPPEVQARLEQVLADEQRLREAGELPDRTEAEELLRLEECTNRGSFGPNAPASYSPDGLGLTSLG
ncbi:MULTISPECIES: hypothetical protein [unclassified Luteococcus]|uniref:hypothetical protein n=1 Tax=unclassified Luteococcus TaxID=2639923 RepID=UPI00313E53F6